MKELSMCYCTLWKSHITLDLMFLKLSTSSWNTLLCARHLFIYLFFRPLKELAEQLTLLHRFVCEVCSSDLTLWTWKTSALTALCHPPADWVWKTHTFRCSSRSYLSVVGHKICVTQSRLRLPVIGPQNKGHIPGEKVTCMCHGSIHSE